MEAAGLRVTSVQELPISTLSFDSTARGVASSGADHLFFIGDASSNASMARSMADTGYRTRFAEYFTFVYGTDFIEAAGPAAEGATTWLRTLPNEEADRNEEVARYLEWMDRIATDDVRDAFAADAWAATKAFFDALEALPGPITRDAFIAQLASIETYDAGGLLGPIRLGAERTNGCFVGLRVEDGQWRRLAPAAGFLCA
jgi:ABC-type branched-subunit amino acid transport system substrate-binding protein